MRVFVRALVRGCYPRFPDALAQAARHRLSRQLSYQGPKPRHRRRPHGGRGHRLQHALSEPDGIIGPPVGRRSQSLAHAVATAASELVTNAQRHSRSGDPGGTVRVEIERGPHLVLRVTDNGPRPGARPTVPHIPALERSSGRSSRSKRPGPPPGRPEKVSSSRNGANRNKPCDRRFRSR